MYDEMSKHFNQMLCDMQEQENYRREQEYLADMKREEDNINLAAELINENNNQLLKPIIDYCKTLSDDQLKELQKFGLNYIVDVFLYFKDLLTK